MDMFRLSTLPYSVTVAETTHESQLLEDLRYYSGECHIVWLI